MHRVFKLFNSFRLKDYAFENSTILTSLFDSLSKPYLYIFLIIVTAIKKACFKYSLFDSFSSCLWANIFFSIPVSILTLTENCRANLWELSNDHGSVSYNITNIKAFYVLTVFFVFFSSVFSIIRNLQYLGFYSNYNFRIHGSDQLEKYWSRSEDKSIEHPTESN